MAESTEKAIVIFNPNIRVYKPLHAMLVQNVSSHIIQRSCVEALRQPWEPSDGGISYDFSDYASPPLGQCELDWGWNDASATAPETFIVVEEVKGNPYGIILGPSALQRPEIPRSNDIYAVGVRKRTREQQQEQRESARLAAQRRPGEKAQDDAKIQERRVKKRQEEQEAAPRAKLT